jgi:site-specific recombinase XerD
MDIHQLIDLFIADVCAGKSNETPKTYRSKLKRFAVFMDANQLTPNRLRVTHVEDFRDQLHRQSRKRSGSHIISGHLSPFTIHTVMRTLIHFLRWAFHKGYLRDCGTVTLKPPPLPDPKAIDADNALALMHAAARTGEGWERARNLAMLYLLRDTGGRIGAVLNVDMDNLDLMAGKLFTKTKGDKPITLYINPPAIDALREWLNMRSHLEPVERKVFITLKGTGMTRSGFYSMLGRLIDAAGLRGVGRVNPHSFRHAWARDALTHGADLTRVSQTLGHTSLRVTGDYYARWTDGELKTSHAQHSPGASLPKIHIK